MIPIKQIVTGHIKEALNLDRDLSEQRMAICYSCPLYSSKLGGICNNKLWLNPITGDVSTRYKDGYKNGCSCRLNAKTRLPDAHCPLDKW